MRLLLAAPLLASAMTTPSVAQETTDCDWKASAQAIAEPWEENTRTFSNGNVRLALSDVGEPAVGGYHIIILSPPRDELGARQCRILTWTTYGFGKVEFDKLSADYDPARGLLFSLPVGIADNNGDVVDRLLVFTLNQATGEIASDLTPY